MPAGKNASYRYRLIDLALRNTGRRWKLEDLLSHIREKLEEEFDVNISGNKKNALSERQLLYDISIMRKDPPEGYSAPIIRKDGFIFYEDPGFSINDNPLNETDIDTLNEVSRLLRSFQSLPHLQQLDSVIGKVKGTISQSQGEQIIELEHNPTVVGLNHLDSLYNSIRDGKSVKITYQPFNRDLPYEEKMHPYLIKEYNNRWFLIGWKPSFENYTIYALDRIKKVERQNDSIDMARRKDLIARQKHIIGVSMGGDLLKLKLWVNTGQLPYFLTKPLHHTQELLEEKEDGAILAYQICWNYELEQAILSFGEKVKVLEPEECQRKISNRIDNARRLYYI